MSEMKISDAILYGNKNLKKTSSNYKNETIWILSQILSMSSSRLILNQNQKLNDNDYTYFKKLIKRRKNEPLQIILGNSFFYGRAFKVNKNVFIPRQETEIIIDILKKQVHEFNSVLEIGSGSGIIPITIFLENISANITSVDISYDAYQLSRQNADLHDCNEINFINESIFKYYSKSKFDLIISNPPYIPIQEIINLENEVILYDPLESLTDFSNGLKFYQFFFQRLKNYLNDGGIMLLEFGGLNQIDDIKKMLADSVDDITFYKDLNNDPRFVMIKLNS
tara:strand:- start:9212 stop:10054 length:843 start_codon:yes stop_codon:yes gene_type:complete